MEEFGVFFNPYGIAIVAIVGGIVMAIFTSAQKTRVRELEIRERIAMIERGMVPAPEADPQGFERQMQAVVHVQDRHAGVRFRTGGIIVMSVGLGLMTLLWFVGVPNIGIGLGGFLGFLGLGLLVSGALSNPPLPHSSLPRIGPGVQPPDGPRS